MNLTNRQGLPQAIVDAVRQDPYSRGESDISVTQLISPPRKVALEREHADEVTEDASERIWSLLGQSIHTILERANRTSIAERRLTVQVEGWTVSGGMDLYDENGTLTDYKVTSAWSVKGGVKPEWIEQLNSYAEILRANGHGVKALKVVAILRDWSKLEARREATYPQSQVVTFSVELWDADKAARFVRDRVILHQKARLALPECTPEERWQKPTVYALMKVGGKRAVKLYDNEADALAHASVDPKNLRVEVRPGESTRCEAYCNASEFCTQHQQERAQPEPQTKESEEV